MVDNRDKHPLLDKCKKIITFMKMTHDHALLMYMLLMLLRFEMIYLMRSILSNSRLFQKKVKIVSLQKSIPNLAYTLSGVSVVLDLATDMER